MHRHFLSGVDCANHAVRGAVPALAAVPVLAVPVLARVLSESAGDAQLALITCGGDFDPSYRASADNVVAFAALS